MYQGYIKLWRKLQDNDLWKQEKFTRGQAWVDLVLLANHKPNTIRIRGIEIKVDRGQLAYSELTLSKRWKWSRNKTRRFLKELSSKTAHQIKQQTNNLTSLITITNYDIYQQNEHKTEHQAEHQKDTRRYTNKNVKNDKNKYSKDFLEFYSAYPLKKSKAKAFQFWKKLKPDLHTCLAALQSQMIEKGFLKAEKKFCPEWKHPATWLNQGCWEDEVKTEKKTEKVYV